MSHTWVQQLWHHRLVLGPHFFRQRPQIDAHRVEVGVPEEFLHTSHVDTAHQEVNGARVA